MISHCAVTLVALAAVLTSASAQEVTVETSLGSVTGVSSEGVDAFLGIQYATVGERFSQSTLVDQQQNSIINATAYGPFCYQSTPPAFPGLDMYASEPQDEECLYLNIWRPSNITEPLATMVWIHGGAFLVGSGSEPMYKGTSLARDQNVVVVTVNYRLGLFGFLVTDDQGTGGLNGIHDQIQALTWVQNHISSFGGDPSQVTIFGESAGSASVCMLSVSPLSKGLFQRAIFQSGECVFSPFVVPNMPEQGSAITQSILNATGASSVEELADAESFPAEEITGISSSVFVWWPTVDGMVLPKPTRELYTDSSNIIPTEMIMGSNSYDSANVIILPAQAYITASNNMEAVIQSTFPEQADAIIAAYSPEFYDDNQVAAYAQYEGDVTFRCATRELAASISDKVTTYLYNYAHLSTVDPVVWNGLLKEAGINDTSWASHAAEIPLVLGTIDELDDVFGVDTSNAPTSDADTALSQELMARWASFAKTGNPNTNDHGGWEAVPPDIQSADMPTFLIQTGGGVMSSVDEKVEQCSAFPFVTSVPPDDSTTSHAKRSMTRSAIVTVFIATVIVLGLTIWI